MTVEPSSALCAMPHQMYCHAKVTLYVRTYVHELMYMVDILRCEETGMCFHT